MHLIVCVFYLQVGLQIGDQILEVYGVNVRSCGMETAARVLSSRRNTFDMKVSAACNEAYLRGSRRRGPVRGTPQTAKGRRKLPIPGAN